VGATASSSGLAGLVPAPGQGAANRFLRSDGNWVEITVDNELDINLTGEYPIEITEDGVITLKTDDSILGIVDNSFLTIVGFNDAAENSVLTKTAEGAKWIVPDTSGTDDLATAIDDLIEEINSLRRIVT
jgi:hypothetical protein